MEFDSLIINVLECDEFKKVEYLCSAIRKYETFGMITYQSRRIDGVPCKFLNGLYAYVHKQIMDLQININDILYFMIDDDGYDIVFLSFPNWFNDKNDQLAEIIDTLNARKDLHKWINNETDRFWVSILFTNHVIDHYFFPSFSIKDIIGKEIFIHKTNAYNLTNVNDALFDSDGVFFGDKAYYYNPFTNKTKIDLYDKVPAFIKIIKTHGGNCDLLYRLDERLAVHKDEFISYSGIPFAKYYGPNLTFEKSDFKDKKTLIVHINPDTQNKLLMVIKTQTSNDNKMFWHIEVETIPYIENVGQTVITRFIHGMYYPEQGTFTHIDFTVNQYNGDTYVNKYKDTNDGLSIDTYTDNSDMHYKIWCVENGSFSKEMWLELVTVSLQPEYQKLFREIIENGSTS